VHGSTPTQEQVDQINQEFEVHCQQEHPHSLPICGI
jgi:hypothetical protein